MAKYKHITARPTDGGQLFTALSHEFAGPANYVQKLDWRRDLDQEVRREGYEYFSPSGTSDASSNAFPSSSEINLIHMVRRPNGEVAIIVGTKTHLYRYQKSDDISYVPSDYIEAGYFDTTPDSWITIGSGFSTNGNRWQAVDLNGYTIFNNGVDLPVSYRVEQETVTPLYELRENGISSIGSMTVYSGILMLGDIEQIDDLKAWMQGGSPYGVVTANTTRFHNRLIWSQIKEPLKFAATTKGAINADSQTVTLDYAVSSIQVGDQITITGAGTNGGNLTANVASIKNNTLFIDEAASTTVSDSPVMQTAEIGSIIGFEDLMGDGSGIIGLAPLQNMIVIYKDTSIFVGQYTGNTNIPFKFRVITIPSTQALYYKHTLIPVKNSHVYAGRDSFYSFDLTSGGPKELSQLAAVKNVFFDQNEIGSTNDVFAADNVLTNEIWFCFTSLSDDSAICYDYRNNTASTSAGSFSAAASIKKPPATNQDWFIMGTAQGAIFRYGLSNEDESEWSNKKAIYYRRTNSYSTSEVAYSSKLKGGLANLGDAYNEKDFRGYLVQLASQQEENAVLTIKIYGYANAYGSATTLVNGFQITTPATRNLVPCFFRSHLFQDEITATEYKNVRLAARTFDVSMVSSSSEIRQPTLS